jgi:hypothetical protein
VYHVGRIQPYSPIREPQKEVSQEEMWAKLAKHTKPRVEVKLPAETRPLEWQKPVKTSPHGAGYMLSACGKFSVTKDMHELGFSYTAWLRTTQPATNLGCKLKKEEAMALCEAAR